MGVVGGCIALTDGGLFSGMGSAGVGILNSFDCFDHVDFDQTLTLTTLGIMDKSVDASGRHDTYEQSNFNARAACLDDNGHTSSPYTVISCRLTVSDLYLYGLVCFRFSE